MEPRFEEREYNNDFATWVRHGMNDVVLAERLAALTPTDYPDLDDLRVEIMELVEARLDEQEHLNWAGATHPFAFVSSQIVVFDTGHRLQRPQDLVTSTKQMSASSIFYHFVDARRRTPDMHDDFSEWLASFGDEYAALCDGLQGIDPYFSSLRDTRNRLGSLFSNYFSGSTR